MSAARYPVDTLTQMAAIPEDVLPRFLAELPVMLAEMRAVRGAIDIVNKGAGEALFGDVNFTGAEWVDDDKQTIDQRIEFTDTTSIHIHKSFAEPTP